MSSDPHLGSTDLESAQDAEALINSEWTSATRKLSRAGCGRKTALASPWRESEGPDAPKGKLTTYRPMTAWQDSPLSVNTGAFLGPNPPIPE